MAKKKDIGTEENFDNNEKQNTLRVEIVSNWSLLEILGDWRKVGKIILALLVLVFAIFLALAFVTISIKRIYPYNDIKINAFGATTMENEDVEINYWLFNTADLWANSGIKVKKGDILTIRASGRSHTAIHHLVEDAEINIKLRDKWVDTDGENKTSKRDELRANYRIFANKPQDALLMQVVPIGAKDEVSRDSIAEEFLVLRGVDFRVKHHQKKENYYYIGKERVDLLIHDNGELHFAVNDVVLTDRIIDKMIQEQNDSIRKKYGKLATDSIWANDFFKFGKHPDKSTITRDSNEMTYYKDTHYYNAWYDDNVGSFLIVIERKRRK